MPYQGALVHRISAVTIFQARSHCAEAAHRGLISIKNISVLGQFSGVRYIFPVLLGALESFLERVEWLMGCV